MFPSILTLPMCCCLQSYLKSNVGEYSKEEVEILWIKSTERLVHGSNIDIVVVVAVVVVLTL